MQMLSPYANGKGRLRVVFSGAVQSFGLPTDATFGEVAQALGDLRARGGDAPLAICVKLAAGKSAAPRV